MTSYVRSERSALCDLLLEVGPDAPTLCEGWTARDLAAHLVVRDGRPDTLPGVVVPALSPWTERVRHRAARGPWAELVQRARRLPWWSPLSLAPRLDEAVNLTEVLVHHEDVRRAQPDWRPRDLPADLQDAVWSVLRERGRLFYRQSPVGVGLRRPDGRSVTVRPEPTPGQGVVLVGEPVELLLHAFGRGEHAVLTVEGAAAAVEDLEGTRLGI